MNLPGLARSVRHRNSRQQRGAVPAFDYRGSSLNEMDVNRLRDAWNEASEYYQALHDISTGSAHYGPWAPLENELRLLGDVHGLKILEIGCGGGQCCIAFARQGATIAGIDMSDKQIKFARALAAEEGIDVDFSQGDAADLSQFHSLMWDVIFSTYTFQYVEEIEACLSECSRVLKPLGRLVFSLDHPFRDCFHDDEEDETAIYPVRSYFDRSAMRWTFGDSGVPMVSYHRTMTEWLELLVDAGFQLLQMLEPEPSAEMLDEIWPEDSALAPIRMVPQTIIFVAEKNEELATDGHR